MVNLLRFCINRIGRNPYFWNSRRIGINWWRLQLAALQMRGNYPARSLNYVWMPWQYIISLARYFAFFLSFYPRPIIILILLSCRTVDEKILRCLIHDGSNPDVQGLFIYILVWPFLLESSRGFHRGCQSAYEEFNFVIILLATSFFSYCSIVSPLMSSSIIIIFACQLPARRLHSLAASRHHLGRKP